MHTLIEERAHYFRAHYDGCCPGIRTARLPLSTLACLLTGEELQGRRDLNSTHINTLGKTSNQSVTGPEGTSPTIKKEKEKWL